VISDSTASLPPPTTGPQDYNSMAKPAVGIAGQYLDGVFGAVNPVGSTVRRLTNIGVTTTNLEFNYAFHYVNADATACFHNSASGLDIISLLDGSTLYSNQPVGSASGAPVLSELRGHMTDPDKYYFLNGTKFSRRNLAAQTTTDIRDFSVEILAAGGTLLQVQGGSVNYSDGTQRYVVLKWGDFHHLYDIQTNTIYSGNIPPATTTGYMGLTPDGKFLYSGGNAGPNVGGLPAEWFNSYLVDHVGHSVSATPVQFYALCGDHGVAVSASNGKNYIVAFQCQVSPFSIRAAEMNVDRSAMTTYAAQIADTINLLDDISVNATGHFSAVSRGPNTDWVFHSNAALVAVDDFNQAPSSWFRYRQELLAMNVVTLETRRFCHHRSRGLSIPTYEAIPKGSCSPMGDFYIFDSNFNDNTHADYADLYGIPNPLGSAQATGSALQEDGYFPQEPQTNPVTVSQW
jgi:surface antigen